MESLVSPLSLLRGWKEIGIFTLLGCVCPPLHSPPSSLGEASVAAVNVCSLPEGSCGAKEMAVVSRTSRQCVTGQSSSDWLPGPMGGRGRRSHRI